MFIKIENVNYFVLTENKTTSQICDEIINRMNRRFISHSEKRRIMSMVRQQIVSAG